MLAVCPLHPQLHYYFFSSPKCLNFIKITNTAHFQPPPSPADDQSPVCGLHSLAPGSSYRFFSFTIIKKNKAQQWAKQ